MATQKVRSGEKAATFLKLTTPSAKAYLVSTELIFRNVEESPPFFGAWHLTFPFENEEGEWEAQNELKIKAFCKYSTLNH